MNARIESAIKLEKEEQEKVRAVLQKKFGANISLEFVTSEDVLGGLRVTIDGTQRFDLSVAGRLSQVSRIF